VANDLVVWCGPVFAPGGSPFKNGGEIGNVKWPNPTTIITISCKGSVCGDIAESLRGSDGRILPSILSSHGAGAVSDYDHIALAGYSAGHNMMNRVLQSDGDTIAAMVSIDACFSTTNPPWTKKGYVDFGTQAALGQKLMVLMATGSSHGGSGLSYSSGSECAGANFDAAAAAAGVTPENIDAGLQHPPTIAERAGNLYLLDYGTQTFSNQLPHFDAINLLSEDVLQTYLAPFLGGSLGGGKTSPLGIPWWGWALAAAGVLGAGAAGVAVARRRR
jgi:hypothetical protein